MKVFEVEIFIYGERFIHTIEMECDNEDDARLGILETLEVGDVAEVIKYKPI
jgi:hypothetical protein